VLVAIDRPECLRAAWPLVEQWTGETGLVTTELVPACRTSSGDGTMRQVDPSEGR
jgi:hypothetical protein